MLKIWIYKTFVPKDDLKNYPNNKDSCISIFINEHCDSCNVTNTIYNNFVGSENEETSFDIVCDHNETYYDMYLNRIKTVGDIIVGSVKSTIINSIDDGMKCSGACGQWVPMASPNQKDNTFKCWSCRNRGW